MKKMKRMSLLAIGYMFLVPVVFLFGALFLAGCGGGGGVVTTKSPDNAFFSSKGDLIVIHAPRQTSDQSTGAVESAVCENQVFAIDAEVTPTYLAYYDGSYFLPISAKTDTDRNLLIIVPEKGASAGVGDEREVVLNYTLPGEEVEHQTRWTFSVKDTKSCPSLEVWHDFSSFSGKTFLPAYGSNMGTDGEEYLATLPTLTVALSETTPESATIPAGSANIALTKISFTAGEEDVVIEGLKLWLYTTFGSGTISTIRLLDGVVFAQIGQDQAPYYDDDISMGDFSLAVPAGTTKEIIVLADISPTAPSGIRVGLGINSPNDIWTDSEVAVKGVFMVAGNTMTIGVP